MGMFCVDEVHYPTESHLGIIGGAGTYAALGAAVVLPLAERQRVGFICDEGHDFSPDTKKEMENWSMGTIFRYDPNRETTKAWNKFVDNEERLFKYLSPKLQIVAEDMQPPARNAKVVHLICSPQRAFDFLNVLKSENPGQKYVWEPVPTECKPEQFPKLKSVITQFAVDVLTPNALEAAAFVGLAEPQTKGELEALVDTHYQFAPVVVIRCGSLGSFVRTPDLRKWYPAYFTSDQQHRVVDPSGAGNAFTGGLGEALAQNLDWDHAIAYASVGASFMIEQLGTPTYNKEADLWNGESGRARIEAYLKRINTA